MTKKVKIILLLTILISIFTIVNILIIKDNKEITMKEVCYSLVPYDNGGARYSYEFKNGKCFEIRQPIGDFTDNRIPYRKEIKITVEQIKQMEKYTKKH